VILNLEIPDTPIALFSVFFTKKIFDKAVKIEITNFQNYIKINYFSAEEEGFVVVCEKKKTIKKVEMTTFACAAG
jgi:hypothetical protein